MGFLDFIANHTAHAAPVLIAGAIATAIIIERVRSLFKTYAMKNPRSFMQQITHLMVSGQSAEAISLCDQNSSKPMASVVKEGLLRAHQPEDMLANGLELSVGDWSHHIQKRTQFLATIANVATLLGLFGTIAGLIHSFQAVAHADPQQKSALLAQGISTAMNATMLGLGVAIPCMIAFSFLVNRANSMVAELDQSAVQTIDIIRQSYLNAESDAVQTQSKKVSSTTQNTSSEARSAA